MMDFLPSWATKNSKMKNLSSDYCDLHARKTIEDHRQVGTTGLLPQSPSHTAEVFLNFN